MQEKNTLFEITEENLETGMRGYPVGYCVTSFVDPQKGLHYLGTPISELTEKEPEEIIHFLYKGRLPDPSELESFKSELVRRAGMPSGLLRAIQALPREGEPIELFATAILFAGMLEKKGDYHEDCMNLVAQAPAIAACVINHHMGKPQIAPSTPEKGYIENFAHMLDRGDQTDIIQVFRLFNILHYDHGGGNLSAFVGKAVASGLEHTYGAIAAAILGLAGPRHGKANQDCLAFTKGILEQATEHPTEKDIEEIVRNTLKEGKLVFGFGHAVLRAEDPRATILYKIGEEHFSHVPLYQIAELLHKVAPRVLMENPKISNPYPNVDAISGTILSAAGFAYPEYFPVLFALSRLVGICRQIIYERCEARGGRGTPIVRPKYLYKQQ